VRRITMSYRARLASTGRLGRGLGGWGGGCVRALPSGWRGAWCLVGGESGGGERTSHSQSHNSNMGTNRVVADRHTDRPPRPTRSRGARSSSGHRTGSADGQRRSTCQAGGLVQRSHSLHCGPSVGVSVCTLALHLQKMWHE
jgi:hypothetical protein